MEKIKRPGQLTYLAAIPMPTSEGQVFLYMAIDHYSEFVMDLGFEEVLNEEMLIQKIKQLLQDPNFKKHTQKMFTIMLPVGEEIEQEINQLIKPKGNIIFDEKATLKVADTLVKMGFLKQS
jgi:hypothetical protein